MPAFACRTRDASGALVERTVDAPSQREAVAELERSGLFAVRVTQLGAGSAAAAPPAGAKPEPVRRRRGRIGRKDLMRFSTQLSSSLSAGVPILGGLRSMRKLTRNEAFRDVLSAMVRDIEGGLPLSEAMRRHPDVFPAVYVGTIAAGERSSMLDEMLENLASFLEGELELRADLRSAMLYPAIVVGTLVLAVSVLVLFVVPRFTAFYAGFDTELPLPTRVLVGTSELLTEQLLWVVVGLAAAGFGAMRLLRVPAVRRWVDRVLLRAPVVGPVVRAAVTLQLVQVLGLSTRAGVPVLDALRSAAGAMGNSKARADLATVASGIAVGNSLADGLESLDSFPLEARHMLASGEGTGSLERACASVAKHFQKELRYRTKMLSTVLEPLLTLTLAAVVLFVALAAFLPMWDLVKVVGG